MRYFPLLRGKQHELVALRELAGDIAKSGNVVPILEPVNANATTRKSMNRFMVESMPFLFICNPRYGEFANNTDGLVAAIISQDLSDYDNWIPTLTINEATSLQDLDAFTETYTEYQRALVYDGMPHQDAVLSRIGGAGIDYHVFMSGRVESSYIDSVPVNNRVFIEDSFRRQTRNADYPVQEFFTDQNTAEGNKDNVDFGDFSIVGDYYSETGGPAHAVALHHIHFGENSHSLYIHHFISDHVDLPVDTPGKTIEAVTHLVEALGNLQPNETRACQEYRTMSRTQNARSLGYMKRLAIMHHLEVILSNGGLAN